jgi:hypothetical protein
MDLQHFPIIIILILVLILQIYIAYAVYNMRSYKMLEKFGNGCRPGQLKNFGICMNPNT